MGTVRGLLLGSRIDSSVRGRRSAGAFACSVQTDTPQENLLLYTIAVILLIAPEFQLIRISKPLSTRARSAIREAIRIRFTGESGQRPGTYGNNT